MPGNPALGSQKALQGERGRWEPGALAGVYGLEEGLFCSNSWSTPIGWRRSTYWSAGGLVYATNVLQLEKRQPIDAIKDESQ